MALTEGPLISIQSLILGVIGLIVILQVLVHFAKEINLVDVPDDFRKQHIGKIPLVGGIGVFSSLIYGAFVFGVQVFYLYLLASLVPIMIAGIIDGFEKYSVPPSYRIIAQIVSSWLVILLSDVYLRDIGNLFGFGNIYLGELGIPFTIFAVVGMCNAFNMLDGKDGLLGSTVVLIMASLLLLLSNNGINFHWGSIVLMSTLIFLAFNLNLMGKKRKIFLGDHGSSSLGHIVAWSLIYLSQETNYMTPASAIWFVLLPLTDALMTFARRAKSSNSIFSGDRLHFHHRLSDNGFSDKKILIIFCLITIIGCSFGVAANIFMIDDFYLIYAYLTLLVIIVLSGFLKIEKK
ncbi:MAG: hypothetical protein CMD35_01205 [Flavobacteriales bacterium]|nr:hypothetical protein [Flavobacteriales bacterium]